jgi:hypothetical protein
MFEQFYKLAWLIHTHYRAMLIAERYKQDPLAFLPTTLARDEAGTWFEGEVLVLRSSSDVMEALPPCPEIFAVHCVLLGAHPMWLRYGAEHGMNRLLDIKGRTGGLSLNQAC